MKQIIKLFALDYTVYMFGRRITWTRSANVIFPLVLLNGLMTLKDVPFFAYLTAVCLLFISLFLGFLYFDIKPLKETDYNYFDKVQKFTWDMYHSNTPVDIEKSPMSKQWVFWVNPVLFTLTLLYCLLKF